MVEMMEKPEYRCVVIIEDNVRAESIDEAKEIMCDIKIQKQDIIAEIVNHNEHFNYPKENKC